MNKKQIDRFFTLLSQKLSIKSRVILTGAAAGAVLGNIRPSVDIDFAIETLKKDKEGWEEIQRAIEQTMRLTGIQAQYAEDIDRWGLITLLDYKRHTLPYRKFGRLQVCILEPIYWSIGKITRYLDPDVEDMIRVFKRRKINPHALAKIWGKALKKSPRSAMLLQFRKQVQDFFKVQGRKIWGKTFNREKVLKVFLNSAGIN